MVVKAETTDEAIPEAGHRPERGPRTRCRHQPSAGRPTGPQLVLRLLAHVDAGTTDLAERLLEVPLDYYRDPDRFTA